MKRADALTFAKKQIADDVEFIDVIGQLEARGWPSVQAEEIVEQAAFDLRNEHE